MEIDTQRRGRPRIRYADREEQVRQNMRLYRARRKAELEALGRALNTLEVAVSNPDPEMCRQAAVLVAGLWSTSTLKDNVIKSSKSRTKRRSSSPAKPLDTIAPHE